MKIKKYPKTIKIVLSLLISISLMLYAFKLVNFSKIYEVLLNLKIGYFIIYLVVSFVCLYLVSIRFSWILAKQGNKVSSFKVFSASLVTSFYGLFLPGGISNSVKWLILTKHTKSGTSVLAVMFYNQFWTYAIAIII